MKLIELFQIVKDDTLQKDQLEKYRDQLASLYAEMTLEYATLEKKEAMFLLSENQREKSMALRKAEWKGTDEGQRMIDLKNWMKGTAKVIDSLKSRLYSLY